MTRAPDSELFSGLFPGLLPRRAPRGGVLLRSMTLLKTTSLDVIFYMLLEGPTIIGLMTYALVKLTIPSFI